MSRANLERMFARADADDLREAAQAYFRYHRLMREIADAYTQPFERTVAAFAALSPNNDYVGNLRSLVSVLDGIKAGAPLESIVVSTYKHCRDRAYSYLVGAEQFPQRTTGLKILNFYMNIIDPTDLRWVTIDGHMCAAYRGDDAATMKDAIVRSRAEYEEIAFVVKECARAHFMLPHQYQAAIWFARKRTLRVRFDAQINLFRPRDDLWQISHPVAELKPYPRLDGGANHVRA